MIVGCYFNPQSNLPGDRELVATTLWKDDSGSLAGRQPCRIEKSLEQRSRSTARSGEPRVISRLTVEVTRQTRCS